MAFLVAVLWGCLIAERLIIERANRDMGRVLKTSPEHGVSEKKLQRKLNHPRAA